MCDDEVAAYAISASYFEPVITFREPTTTVMDTLRDLLVEVEVTTWRHRLSFICKGGRKKISCNGNLTTTLRYLQQMLWEDYADSEREIDPSWGRFEYGIGHWKDDHRVVAVWNRIFSPQPSGSLIYASEIRRVGRNKYWILGGFIEEDESAENDGAN